MPILAATSWTDALQRFIAVERPITLAAGLALALLIALSASRF